MVSVDMQFSSLQPITAHSNGMQTPGSLSNKRKRKKSMVWDYFNVEAVDTENSRAFCKQCKKSFAYISGSKIAGTSHLKRHILLGICSVGRLNQEKNQLKLYTSPTENGSATAHQPKKRVRGNSKLISVPFDQLHCNHELVRMIILHEYPLHMVEDPGFIDFIQALQPKLDAVSLVTVESQCLDIFSKEKHRLACLLSDIGGRVSLTLDLWRSDQTTGYAILRGHFVDCDWRLHHRILNVIMVPFIESEVAFNDVIVSCLSNWGLESKLFFLTLDESFASEAVIGNVWGLVSIKKSQTFKNRYVIGNCSARMLTRLAQAAIGRMGETVEKVRKCVKYVKTSDSNEGTFNELRKQLQVPSTASLVMDNQTRWDSTYHMLLAASELKEVFSCLDICDQSCTEIPTTDEWQKIEILCGCLKLLFDAANSLSLEAYTTTNKFFHKICQIRHALIHAADSPDPFVSSLSTPMLEIFEKYWREYRVILSMVVIMDPRYKFKPVESSFTKIDEENGECLVKIVEDAMLNLFLEYESLSYPLPDFNVEQAYDGQMEGHDEGGADLHDDFPDFDVYISAASSNNMKTDLEQYLEEAVLHGVVDQFNVLGWWKANIEKYPTLSKMAADLLSIPVSTVAPDHVFDTESTKLDSYRCSLKPHTLEALICAKDWLQSGQV